MSQQYFNAGHVRELTELALRFASVYIKDSGFKEGLKRNLEAVINACEAEQEHLSGHIRVGDL